jgi:hypothetical protein
MKNPLKSKPKTKNKQMISHYKKSDGTQLKSKKIKYQYNDGGRKISGFSDFTKDCVTRSVKIILDCDYFKAYQIVNSFINENEEKRISHACLGVSNKTTKKLFRFLGFKWYPSNDIPKGKGKYILNMPNHVCAFVDGVLLDTHNYFEKTKRIYGYWKF